MKRKKTRKRRKGAGAPKASRKKTRKTRKGAGAPKKALKRKRPVRKAAAKSAGREKPSAKSEEAAKAPYVAPRRHEIKDAVCALLPHVDPKLVKQLDYWALYTIHQDVVKDGKDAEALARKLIRGYDPSKNLGVVERPVPQTPKEEERMKRVLDLERRIEAARQKALAAKDRERAAKEKARAAAHAAKERARAAIRAARDKARAARLGKAAPAAPEKATAAAPAAAPAAVAAPRKAMGSAYVAPVRTRIKDELAKVMPMIKRSDLTGIDYWALYTMHSEIVKYGRNPEELARKFVKGYTKAKK